MKQTSPHYPTTPFQKLTHLGPNPLSDEDLLSILLTRSPKHPPTPTLTRSVLSQLDTLNDHLTTTDLTSLPGITQSQATHLLAAFEFTRRRIKPAHLRISTPEDIATLTRHYATRPQEHFICISLNGAHEVIAIRCVTIGLVNSTQVHPREVFADPITDRAAAVALAHNHPSGELKPSGQDLEVTKVLIEAGRILGIRVLDHVIVGADGGFVSLREDGGICF